MFQRVLEAEDGLKLVADVDVGKSDKMAAEVMMIIMDRFPQATAGELSGILINAWFWLIVSQMIAGDEQ